MGDPIRRGLTLQLGTYIDGRALGYSEASQRFDLGGAQVSHDHVRQWDEAGQITWVGDDLRSWAYQLIAYSSALATAASPPATANPTTHQVPKCLSCGHVGPWKVDGLFRPMDWLIGLGFLVFFGTGLVYMLVVGLIRLNKNNRAKICTNCKARNMFAFQY
jgi:hypothetical protein